MFGTRCAPWVMFLCVACGLASRPPLQGIRAALARKIIQWLLGALWALRLQDYVNDPILTAAGSHEQRRWLFTVVILFWAALCFKWILERNPERPKGRADWWRIGLRQEGAEAKARASKDSVDELVSLVGYLS